VLLSSQINMTLTPTILQGQTKWELSLDATGKHGTLGSYPALDIGTNSPATLVQITIDNSNSSIPWSFAHDGAALWVNQGPGDPTGPSTSPQVPVAYINTSKQDSVLSFMDLNQGDPVTLHYTLNMVSGTRKASTLDPIIRNGGCCHVAPSPGFLPTSTTTFLAELAIAFILGALVMLIVNRFRSVRNPSQTRTRD
jgi:hypothetical protein